MTKIIDITKNRSKSKEELQNIQKVIIHQKMIKLQMELAQMDKLMDQKLENKN